MKAAKLLSIVASVPKTLYANFKYLPFCQAVKFPLFVHWNSSCKGNGKILLGKVKPGIIRLGSADPTFPSRKFVLCLTGTLEFMGNASIGTGSEMVVRGHLVIGDNFSCSGGQN